MKQLLSLFVALLLVFSIPIVIAQEETAEEEDEEIAEEAGITPDSKLWGLERAMERISLALTFNRAAKAKKGLAHAKERLAEVQAMIAAKKIDAAERAKVEHGRALGRVKQEIEKIDEEPEEEIEEMLELENEAEEEENKIGLLQARIKIKGELIEEQEAKIDALLESLKNNADELKTKIITKKLKTKIRIKAVTQKTDEEIEELIKLKEEKLGIKVARARRVEALTKVIEKLEEKKGIVKGIEVSGVIEKLTNVRERLENKTRETIKGRIGIESSEKIIKTRKIIEKTEAPVIKQ